MKVLRIVDGVFAILLLLFAAVQYNDPDALWWGVIYGLAGLWCALVAIRPGVLGLNGLRSIYLICLGAAGAATIFYWPSTPRWWAQDVWWETETAREGMGMMIVLIALLVAGLPALRRAA